MSSYSDHVFGMFTGKEQTVKLRFSSHLAGAVIDRFGKDVMIIPQDAEHFTVSLKLAVSPQFYGWVFGFGNEVEILSPDSVREEMRQHLFQISEQYK
jgi:predicted DNA-binding transcriptional regulator YafY